MQEFSLFSNFSEELYEQGANLVNSNLAVKPFASSSARNTLVIDRRLVAGALLALIVEFWVLFSDVHFLWQPTGISGPRTLVASVQAVSSRVMVRTPLQLSWHRVSPGDSLFEGDEIATLDDATATIRFTDAELLTLGANSMLALRRARTMARQTVKLALVRGTLLQTAGTTNPNSASSFEIEVAGRKLVTNSAAGFHIQNTGVGEPLIRLNDQPLAKHESIVAVSTPPRPTFESLEAARLSSPNDESTISDPDTVKLAWRIRSRPDLTALEIARDEHFTQIVLNRPLPNQTSWFYRPDHKGRYFWRITNGTINGRLLTSEVRSFDIVRTLEKPKLIRPQIENSAPTNSHKLRAPELKRPAVEYNHSSLLIQLFNLAWNTAIPSALGDEPAKPGEPAAPPPPPSTSASGSDSKPSEPAAAAQYKVKLNWYGVAGAHAYTLQISAEPRFTRLAAEKVLTEPAYIWHSEVAGFYYWRVAAIDAEGDRGPFSEFMTFDIKAERNVVGDDSSYETFLRFDEYSAHAHQFRLLLGPTFQRYDFTSKDSANSPASANYTMSTLRQGQAEYAYRINNYYSIQGMLRTEAQGLQASNFRNLPRQNGLHYNETVVSLAVERRFFEPTHYYTLQAGIRNTFVDIPTKDSDTQLTLSTFSFIGPYATFGYNKPLSHSKAVNDIFTYGLRFEEDYRYYNFGSDLISGTATSAALRIFGFLEFNF